MTGPKYPTYIKRRLGVKHCEDSKNIQYEEQRKVDPELQIHFHIWCVVGYNFKFAIPYSAGNSNGKMTIKIYITVILPALQAHLLERGGEYILWQHRDSAHISKKKTPRVYGLPRYGIYIEPTEISRYEHSGDLGCTNPPQILYEKVCNPA